MTFRIKCKVLLLIPVAITIFYLSSHVQKLNTWLVKQTAFYQQERNVKYENSHYINSLHKLSTTHSNNSSILSKANNLSKTTINRSPNNALSTKYKYNNRYGTTTANQNTKTEYSRLFKHERKDPSIQASDGTTKIEISKYSNVKIKNEETEIDTSKVSGKEANSSTNDIRNETNKNTSENVNVDDTEYLQSSNGKQFYLQSSVEPKLPSTSTTKGLNTPIIAATLAATSRHSSNPNLHPQIVSEPSLPSNAPVAVEKPSSSGDEEELEPNDNNNANLDSKNGINSIELTPVSLPTLGVKKKVENTVKPIELPEIKVVNEFEREKQLKNKACNRNYNIYNVKPKVNSKCLLYSNSLNTCEESAKYYTENYSPDKILCKNKIEDQICRFTDNSSRTDKISELQLKCNQNLCNKKTLEIGIIDQSNGKMDYFGIDNVTAIKRILSNKRKEGARYQETDFVFLQCQKKKEKSKIHQILQFPPYILTKDDVIQNKKQKKKYNINIITVDSVSRPHFFRMLPKTIRKMREINTQDRGITQILDFKGFQSLAPFTFVNLQALLSGVVDYKSVTSRRYNVENLFQYFKDGGYQTLLQEDACWYDKWGSILTGNRLLKTKTKNYRKSIWDEVLNLTRLHSVDSLGVTHMSCEVLKKYGVTNLFNIKKTTCLNGKPLSAYFLEHLQENMVMQQRVKERKPLLSYTHLNFGHESSGLQISVLDSQIQKFISLSSELEDTITILWSDHGGKTTQYSMDTLTGRFEVFDPFLFIIVPKDLKSTFGEIGYTNLIENQNSLTNVLDLRNTLLEIVQKSNGMTPSHENAVGLTSEILKLRDDCSTFPARKYSLCKCINKLEFRDVNNEENKNFLIWLGEYSIGLLNNRLSNQQSSDAKNKCIRLIGKTFDNVISKQTKTGMLWIFDVVTPFKGRKELFNFQILFNKQQDVELNTLTMEKFQRVSVFSRYSSCKDENVSNELCICANNIRVHITMANLNKYQQFNKLGSVTSIYNSPCLFLITRNHGNVVAMEIANLCIKDLDIEFTTGTLFSWEISEDLPITRTVGSNKIIFVATFLKVLNYDEEIKPDIQIINIDKTND